MIVRVGGMTTKIAQNCNACVTKNNVIAAVIADNQKNKNQKKTKNVTYVLPKNHKKKHFFLS